MKTQTTARFALLIALLGSPVLFAAETGKKDPYSEAVSTYVDGATTQLKAIRESVNTVTEKSSVDVKNLYADVYKRLDACDKLVNRLKTATQKDFDTIKSEFERVLADMVKTLENTRRAL